MISKEVDALYGMKKARQGWIEIEKTQVFGTLGDAVKSLQKLPEKYLAADLKLLEGDAYDNAPSEHGPDDDGTVYRVDHTRVVSLPCDM